MIRTKTLRIAAALAAAGLGLAASASGASADTSTTVEATLASLNGSGISGTASAEVTHNHLDVTYDAAGVLPNAVHAVHIHFGKTAQHECPTQAADGGDGQLTTGEGQPFYGPVAESLTNSGDTSPASVLALDRYSTAPDGTLSYDRKGIKTKGTVANAIAAGEGVVVIHGVDYNDNGVYDFDAGVSDLDPALPAEATDLAPAACSGRTTGSASPGHQTARDYATRSFLRRPGPPLRWESVASGHVPSRPTDPTRRVSEPRHSPVPSRTSHFVKSSARGNAPWHVSSEGVRRGGDGARHAVRVEEVTLRHGDEVLTELGRVTTWEKRLKAPVLLAAIAVLPLVALGLSQPTGAWHTVETVGHWAVWLTFVVEVTIMLTVVHDRLGWIGGHRFELLVVLVSSPLVPLALAVAPALRLLIVVKAFRALKLSKAIKLAKLQKSVRLVRRKLALTGAVSIALGLLALVLGGLTAAYMVTGRSPLKGVEESAALVAAGVLVTFGVNHLRARSAGSE